MADRLLIRKEVAARCGIKHSLLYQLMRRGDFLGDFPEPLQIGATGQRVAHVRLPAGAAE